MAHLIDNNNIVVYLLQYHTFGRLRYSVDTVVNGSEISRYHAVMEWRNAMWMIKDVSTNGVWINQTRIPKNEYIKLNEKDSVSLGSADGKLFTFTDSTPPEDTLYLFDEANTATSNIICLQSYNMLPNDDAPTLALYKNKGGWWSEDLGSSDIEERCLQDRDLISIEGVRWQLRLAQLNEQTINLEKSYVPLDGIIAEFHVSQDEESIQLIVLANDDFEDLKVRNYHYLSLYLARRRAQDAMQGLAPTEQGWIYNDEAAKALDMEEMHLNLHVHRARKQFVKVVSVAYNASNFIERRPHQIRFGSLALRIIKAGQVEFDSVSDITNIA